MEGLLGDIVEDVGTLGCGDDPSAAASTLSKVGPENLLETFSWAERYVKRLAYARPDMHANLKQLLSSGRPLALCTDYSGMGCAEMAMTSIIESIMEEPVELPIKMYRASDISETCRRVLLEHPCAPLHVFGDIFGRVPTSAKESMMELQRCVGKHVKGKMDALAMHRWGRFLSKGCRKIMAKAVIDPDRRAHCYRHGCKCRVAPSGEGVISILVAGVTCTDFSSMGARRRSAGVTTLCFHAFAAQALVDAPHMILLECVKGFEVHNLNVFNGAYIINHIDFSPKDLGFAVSRPRKYMLLLHRDKVQMTATFNRNNFGQLFFAPCTMNPLEYFVVDDDTRYQYVIVPLVAQRGLPEKKPNGEPWMLHEVLAPGTLQSLLHYKERALQEDRAILGVLNQNERFSTVGRDAVPTLLRRADIYSTELDKMLVSLEHLLVMGIAHKGMKFLPTCSPCFPTALLEVLSSSQIKSLSGNGMHLASVGACLLFALGQACLA